MEKVRKIILEIYGKLKKINHRILILAVLALFAYFINSLYLLSIVSILLWGFLVVFCMNDLDNRGFMFIFIILFLLFLLGRPIVSTFFPSAYPSFFSKKTQGFILFALFISMLSLYMGTLIFEKNVEFKRQIKENRFIMKIVLLIFFFSCICLAVQSIEQCLFIFKHGYLSLFTDFETKLPSFVAQGANLFMFSFLILLGQLSKKKPIFILLVIFILFSFLTMLNGKRGTFMINLVLVFAYLIYKDCSSKDKNRFFTKKRMAVAAASLPFVMMFLNSINEIRYGSNDFNINPITTVSEFLYKNGSSSNVIGYTKDYQKAIPKQNYLYGSVMRYVNENSVIIQIFNIPQYGSNTVERATKSSDYSTAISYAVLGERYLNGEGLGSCYIAEMYYIFGIFGIIIINLLFAFVFCRIYSLLNKSIFMFAISFLILSKMFWAPRAEALSFILYPLNSINTILFFIITKLKKEYFIWKK